MRFRTTVAAALCFLASAPGLSLGTEESEPPAAMSKETKVLWVNAGATAALAIYGTFFWNYGDRWIPHTAEEHWFGEGTKHGGVDKFGHFYTGYLGARLFSKLYEGWGYTTDRSAWLGFLSSMAFTTAMEVGDGFSPLGSSYEDAVSNLVGAFGGYVLHRYPALADKIDFRVEFLPSFTDFKSDVTTDYEHMKHLIAFKAEGFHLITNKYLKYLELHVGYYARHFEGSTTKKKERIGYVALGLNLSRVLRGVWGGQVFNYYQAPYTYLPLETK